MLGQTLTLRRLHVEQPILLAPTIVLSHFKLGCNRLVVGQPGKITESRTAVTMAT